MLGAVRVRIRAKRVWRTEALEDARWSAAKQTLLEVINKGLVKVGDGCFRPSLKGGQGSGAEAKRKRYDRCRKPARLWCGGLGGCEYPGQSLRRGRTLQRID